MPERKQSTEKISRREFLLWATASPWFGQPFEWSKDTDNENSPRGIILRDQDGVVANTNLDQNETIQIQKYARERGFYFEEGYNLVDLQGNSLTNPKNGERLYVRGGDRIGIEAMNFDLIYDETGKIVGLVDDVEGQAVIRNAHTYPPTRDYWGAAVLFEEDYQSVTGVDGVEAILKADFDFYTWPRKDEFFATESPQELIRRRAYILKAVHNHQDQLVSTYHLIAIASFDASGHQRTFVYDPDGENWWNKFQEAELILGTN